MLGTVRDSLLSLIFPQICKVCSGCVEGRSDGPVCSTCWKSTRFFDGTEVLCQKCGSLLGEGRPLVAVFCHRCNDHRYRRAHALGVYEKALAAAVIDLKHRPFIPGRLRTRIDEFIDKSDLINADVLIPVPLALQRHEERGFNQAETIASAIGKHTGLPVDSFSLRRSVHTPLHRGGMDQRAREITVMKAFTVMRPKCVTGKRIVLVDDVLTSGSTASACARVLVKSGADRVDVFTLARAVFR